MINLVNRTVEIKPSTIEKIEKFEVWWLTPWGLMGDLDMAIQRCIANDVDPNACIKGVPAAVTGSSYEVLVL